ncbi:TfoX/Sxy family DNA transformation protein [Vibrio marisflavi]|uniref:DNA transformation protein TfoX1 n=1 Tax=Vibrio marisflavi CECT 7928 TaxID=634439 RepID=A0ABM9A5R9_9VIBR|nr:TfoX/Sxy family DNA transformation protein [Vibrio marisflavi]CAH0540546.1 DNA transformation protein TfoX1 [Vibrio marisflavi CECT 7928]
MDKPILKDSMKLFEPLGRIKSRSMFGGYGIFVDDTMFALIANDKLHIRADDKALRNFKDRGYEPYVYTKKGLPVVTKYFALPDDWEKDSQQTFECAKQAWFSAKKEKVSQSVGRTARLKDLPNLRLATERMLKKAGIESVEALEQRGSVEAFKAIKQSHSSDVSLDLLWALEGAIQGKHWSVIPQARKEELQSHLI